MKQLARASMRTPAVVVALAAAGAWASPALAADGFELTLTGPATPVVGQPVIAQATGSNPPPAEYPYLTWLSADLFRVSAVPTCPTGPGIANQLAVGTGGAILTIAQRVDVDAAGKFSIPIAFTPLVTGPLLVCAYTYNEVGAALAIGSWTVNVQDAAPATPPAPASPPPPAAPPAPAAPAAPASIEPPRVARSGKTLVCTPGTWSNDPTSVSYRWLVDGARKRGATGRRLAVTRGLRGRQVRCKVTATNAGGSATAVSRGMRVR